jgi:glycosyltransferase involved in cell wall biosynthesis
MVILHVVAPAFVGGLERVVETLAAGQRAAGHDAQVAAIVEPSTERHPFIDALAGRRVPVHRLPIAPRAYHRERAAVGRLCAGLEPDVVHTHGARPDVVDAGEVRRSGIPTVSTVHGFTGGRLRNRFYEGLQRAALRRLHAVVAVSRPIADRLRHTGVPPGVLHVIPNAFADAGSVLDRAAARAELGLDPDAMVVGWVGRVSGEKGPDVLLDAIRRLPHLPLTVVMFGDGPLRPGLEIRARDAGLAGRVLWYGNVPRASRLFRAFDLYVLSSRSEGVPIVLFEAMAARVPIIATRVGGVPDVVTPAEAVLVPPQDPGTLAREIQAVCARPATALLRARAARRRLIREFRVPPWVARYDEVYRVARGSTAVRASA